MNTKPYKDKDASQVLLTVISEKTGIVNLSIRIKRFWVMYWRVIQRLKSSPQGSGQIIV